MRHHIILILTLIAAIAISACHTSSGQNDRPVGEQQKPAAASTDTPEVDIDYLTGRFDPARHEKFVLIDTMYADRSGMYMRREAYNVFKRMYAAALKDSVRLVIRSATRNFDAQKGIWERKWNGETLLEDDKNALTAYPDPTERARVILRYSSMPGTSRHHWGTDIDLNAFVNRWFESGEGLEVYTWLQDHAGTFGFCQPYTDKDTHRPYGYEEEKWHWSYKPLAAPLTLAARESLTNEMINGFAGAKTATRIQIVEKYVLGINPDCY